MSDVYVFKCPKGIFGAFWSNGQDGIEFYLPHLQAEVYSRDTNVCLRRTFMELPTGPMQFPVIFYAAKCWLSGKSIDIEVFDVVRSEMVLGTYYPRIWRGVSSNCKYYRGYKPEYNGPLGYSVRNQSLVAAFSLFDGLSSLFKCIEPDARNDKVYGHRIRELLMLACTEVESSLRSVLNANTAPSQVKVRLNTSDYIRLLPVLKLSDYVLSLNGYPGYRYVQPFKFWDSQQPTKSIGWYDAYNSVKHDREGDFNKATFESLVDAMAAVHILILAQWGPEVFAESSLGYSSPFHAISHPVFEANEQYICPAYNGNLPVVNPAHCFP
ncbi:hypothetical protein NPS33_05770 [Pseudomonas putida]|uniref:hypothetical protein n=1 Tax=Pseudomonas putida TaxID=303 RepID=UPI002363DD3B|nr:hypothetical protein [Pseudomonas putida]MDD2014406.1 hypothetical protein [Pseudomonas putida]HDS1772027.1 hypothetical protein [Pseudomonas putida]